MIKTEKLYHKNSYIKDFSAEVVECTEVSPGRFEVVLDRTAFFPNEAGQSADSGTVSGISVLDVLIRDDIIYHVLPEAIPAFTKCECKIDFNKRFEKMQCHTAEHILSGIIYSKYGFENVGFHLGDDIVTFDTSGPLFSDMIAEIEALANEAVFANKPILCEIYPQDSAPGCFYRSKIALSGEIRLVTIEGVDVCACCAPHVAFTGEVGIIKILSHESHRGGSRIYMTAGRRAYEFIQKMYADMKATSALLSVPPAEIPQETQRLLGECKSLRFEINSERLRSAIATASSIDVTHGNYVMLIPSVDMNILREAVKAASPKVSGLLVALTEREGGYSFIIKGAGDIAEETKKATAALGGRGGGRGDMSQGAFMSDIDTIRRYFES